MNRHVQVSKQSIQYPHLPVEHLGNPFLQSRVGETDCTYGETCSHCPRAFLTVAPETKGQERYFLWGSRGRPDSIFNEAGRRDLHTQEWVFERRDYKDLWGPSAIASATPTNDDSQGYFYVTGALENTIAVIEKFLFSIRNP